MGADQQVAHIAEEDGAGYSERGEELIARIRRADKANDGLASKYMASQQKLIEERMLVETLRRQHQDSVEESNHWKAMFDDKNKEYDNLFRKVNKFNKLPWYTRWFAKVQYR